MGQPSEEIVVLVTDAVSDALETPLEDLPPLSDAISLECLNALATADDGADLTVTFPYAGMRVLVHSGDVVYVRPLHRDRGDSSARPSGTAPR